LLFRKAFTKIRVAMYQTGCFCFYNQFNLSLSCEKVITTLVAGVLLKWVLVVGDTKRPPVQPVKPIAYPPDTPAGGAGARNDH
jgi:hypothetical protein